MFTLRADITNEREGSEGEKSSTCGRSRKELWDTKDHLVTVAWGIRLAASNIPALTLSPKSTPLHPNPVGLEGWWVLSSELFGNI